MRPTLSLTVIMQQWGRALRYVPGKVARIIDLCGNRLRHGYPDTERFWSLENDQSDKEKQEQRETFQNSGISCDKCFMVFPVRKDRICPGCGCYVEPKTKVMTEVSLELKKTDPQAIEQSNTDYSTQQREIMRLNGKLNPEEAKRMTARFRLNDQVVNGND